MSEKHKSVEISDEVSEMMDKCANRFTAYQIQYLETALQSRAREMANIRERHGNDFVAVAKAMMYGWARRDGKPTTQKLAKILNSAQLPVPGMYKRDERKNHEFNLEKWNPASQCLKLSKEAVLERKRRDDDFLFTAAAALTQVRQDDFTHSEER